MKKLFEIKQTDGEFYERNIRNFLPEKIIDIHTHIWTGKKRAGVNNPRGPSWPSLVAGESPVEDLVQTYKMLLPDKDVTPLLFGSPTTGAPCGGQNSYVKRSAEKHGFPSLMLSRPEWSGEEFKREIISGGFSGAKPYLSFAPGYIPEEEIRIFDFIPPRQLEILNRHGLILMLHIPRPGRLKDPVNLAQLLEISKSFPRIKVIIAHAGRAYCPSDTGDGFKILEKAKNLFFDISANTNSAVFLELVKSAGPERILFGSDLPITRMRMRRICRRGKYINIVPAGLYGDLSSDSHMEEASGPEAEKLTFFLYEEIDAFRKASKKSGLNSKDIEDVLHDNAAHLLEGSLIKAPGEQLMMELPQKKLKGFPRGITPPAGYEIRTYREGDDAKYVSLMRRAGFKEWDNIQTCLERALPRGIFFAVDKKSGRFAGSCSAWHNPGDFHPFAGELAWLAADPDYRGKGIGELLCRAVINRFAEAGYSRIYLKTDDFRLPAVKTYIKLGFVPAASQSGTGKRWKRISEKLNMRIKGPE